MLINNTIPDARPFDLCEIINKDDRFMYAYINVFTHQIEQMNIRYINIYEKYALNLMYLLEKKNTDIANKTLDYCVKIYNMFTSCNSQERER